MSHQFPVPVSGSAKFYAGIGSRQTPQSIQKVETDLARKLAEDGWILRSGHAVGSDRAFEAGASQVNQDLQVFLPFTRNVDLKPWHILGPSLPSWPEALSVSAIYHPGWTNLKETDRVLHGRNAYQILGPTLQEPVAMVVCWTDGGDEEGGTAQALRIARAREIPIINLGTGAGMSLVQDYLNPIARKRDFQKGDRVRLISAPSFRYEVEGLEVIPASEDGKIPAEWYARLTNGAGKSCWWKPSNLELTDQTVS